ncbi:unnamed protein product [Calicophoron daubneyi]|uniref:Cationic amino acid transporter C-terminal domain-containing protein n=1 Tax=Calicophoron daubneyi TaxID=300641 RepID=A0AAV2T894_CALDB
MMSPITVTVRKDNKLDSDFGLSDRRIRISLPGSLAIPVLNRFLLIIAEPDLPEVNRPSFTKSTQEIDLTEGHLKENDIEFSICLRVKMICESFQRFLSNISRKKRIRPEDISKTKLSRCLSVIDLTALGVGATLGAGAYVVVGEVARISAGPGVVLSFFIAAISSVFSGLCYAEFGARVPKTGSAYIYSYIAVGELMAFVTGWNLILNYLIGTSSVAKAWSSNFDGIVEGQISKFFSEHLAMNATGLAPYVDPFAFGITMVVTAILSIGAQESSMVNNIFTVINLGVISYVIITGFFRVDIANWQVNPDDVPPDDPNRKYVGEGGFLPHGISGVIAGAGTCFYSFVGFDIIATTGEEVKNPQRAVPMAIVCCLSICFVAYALVSAVITLLVPYYSIPNIAPLPFAFARVGWDIAKYVISVGAVCALTTSLMGSVFPLPRILYAMASDGVIFRFFGRVSQRFKTPFLATIISGLLAAILSALFSLKDLVDMMSIGTLFAYSLVAISVLILRGKQHSLGLLTKKLEENGQSGEELPYSVEVLESEADPEGETQNVLNTSLSSLCYSEDVQETNKPSSFIEYIKLSFVPEKGRSGPTPKSEWINEANTYLLLLAAFLINFGLIYFDNTSTSEDRAYFVVACVFTAVFGLLIILLCISLSRQPENTAKVTFKVPAVPWIPALSILINLHLMFKMSTQTWIFYAVWMVVGLFIYFGYGYWHSDERERHSEECTSVQ